jgi:hypothetical protein
MLPNFLVIGAARSGTTSLYEYLRQHAEIFMSPVKEPSYFVSPRGPQRGPGGVWIRRTAVTTLAEYEALFAGAGDARAIGEASPGYLPAPDAPGRIAELLPEVRLVAILRDPVERAYAQYLGLRRDGLEPASTFEEALRDDDRRLRDGWPLAGLVETGKYHHHLSRYYECFPRDRIRVYLHEDLHADPAGLTRDLLSFLDVDPDRPLDTSRVHGRTGLVRNRTLGVLWTHSRRARDSLRPVVPRRVRAGVRRWALRDMERPPLDPVTRARLVRVFRPDILALEELIDRDLSAWLADEPNGARNL